MILAIYPSTPPLTFSHKEKSQCLSCWVYRGGGNGHLQFATILTAWSSVFDNPADHATPPKPPPNQSPGKKKEIITKHDSTVCGRRNVKIMEKVCVMIVAVNLLTLLTLYPPENQNTKKTPKSSCITMPSLKALVFIVLYISY